MSKIWCLASGAVGKFYRFATAVLLVAILLPAPTQAALTGYTDAAAFTADLPGAPTTLDFDSLVGGNSSTFGSTIGNGDTVGGITFTYPTLAGLRVTLEVRNDYDTTSPENALGTDDGGVFQGGDGLELSFSPVNALGLFFTFAPGVLFDDDIVLAAGGTNVGLIEADLQQKLDDGGLVYFLGLIDDVVPFTSAAIDGSGPFFVFTIDDITTAATVVLAVPEPGSLMLMGLGLIGCALLSRRRYSVAMKAAAAAVLLFTAPAQAQRISLESLAGDHDDIQDVQNTGATPIFACGTIDTPGSYVVVQNLDAVGDCLVVAADDVTIDLGGHVLRGDGTGNGITVTFIATEGRVPSNIAVRNGTASGLFEGIGLNAATGVRVSKIRAIANGSHGIRVGAGSMVTGNVSSRNGGFGLRAGADSTVSGNTVSDNSERGISAGPGSTVSDNTASGNGGDGIVAASSSVITGNSARNNTLDGIAAGPGSSVTGNAAFGNGDDGIVVQNRSTIRGNTTSENGNVGLFVVCPSNAIGNTAVSNTGLNLRLVGGGCNDVDNLAP